MFLANLPNHLFSGRYLAIPEFGANQCPRLLHHLPPVLVAGAGCLKPAVFSDWNDRDDFTSITLDYNRFATLFYASGDFSKMYPCLSGTHRPYHADLTIINRLTRRSTTFYGTTGIVKVEREYLAVVEWERLNSLGVLLWQVLPVGCRIVGSPWLSTTSG